MYDLLFFICGNYFIFAGLCNDHPCPFYPLPDLNGCPFGCMLENYTVDESSSASDLLRTKNIKSVLNNLILDDEEIINQKMLKKDKTLHSRNISHFKSDDRTAHTTLGENNLRRCVVESCAIYQNDSSCLNHTEKKCLTTNDGCRFILIVEFVILVLFFIFI